MYCTQELHVLKTSSATIQYPHTVRLSYILHIHFRSVVLISSHLAVHRTLAAHLVAPEASSKSDSNEDYHNQAHQDPGEHTCSHRPSSECSDNGLASVRQGEHK